MFNFVDAVKMHELHPYTFELPLPDKMRALKPGHYVKICHNEERFWVIVKEINNDKIKGIVNNDLIREQPFKCDDEIEFEKRHIYNILVE
jgi:hypothetical protein